MAKRPRGLRAAAFAAAALLLAGPEAANLALTRHPDVPGAYGNCQVLVLGFSGRADGSPGWIQRYRVASGLAAQRKYGCSALILSGAAVRTRQAEADVMEKAALAFGADPRTLILDRRARTTRENVANALARLGRGQHLFIASDPFHVWRAKRDACRLRPDACPLAHDASLRGPWRLAGYRWLSAYYNVVAVARDVLSRPHLR